jgi:NhaP-type Na+/H+ or K+/H+ antiporter
MSEVVFLMGLLIGFVVGYGMGLLIDKLDKRIKDGGR